MMTPSPNTYRAIKIAADDPHLYYNLAVALYSKKEHNKALKTILNGPWKLSPGLAKERN